MRRLAWSLLLLTTLAPSATACGGDDDGGTPDAPPAPDAPPGTPDAGAPPDGGMEGTLDLVVYDDFNEGAPAAGVDVVVHAPDGTVKATLTTDALGQAKPTVSAGDMVTVAQSYQSKGTEYRLFTFVGVAPGDDLHVGTPPSPVALLGTVGVTAPGDVAGASLYRADTGCGGIADGSPPIMGALDTPVLDVCHADPSKTAVLLLAYDAANLLVAFAADPGVTLTGGSGAVAFGQWRTDFDIFTSSVTGQPAAHPPLLHDLLLFSAGGQWFQLSFPETLSNAETTAVKYQVPKDLATTWAHMVAVSDDSNNSRVVARAGALPLADQTLAFDTDFLAPIASMGYDPDPADVARPTLTWAQSGTGGASAADGVLAGVTYVNGNGFATWRLVVPPGAASVKLPALPEMLAAYRADDSGVFLEGTLAVIESDALPDYAALRPLLGSVPDTIFAYARLLGGVATGQVRIAYFAKNFAG